MDTWEVLHFHLKNPSILLVLGWTRDSDSLRTSAPAAAQALSKRRAATTRRLAQWLSTAFCERF